MTTHLSFDDSTLSRRENPYDLGGQLGRKTSPLPYLPPEGLESFMPSMLSNHSAFHIPPSLSLPPFSQEDHSAYSHFLPNGTFGLYDVQPPAQEPSPHRSLSPPSLYSSNITWTDPDPSTHFPMNSTVGSAPELSYYPETAPTFPPTAPFASTSTWSTVEPQPPAPPPSKPPPSWTMSGSLDPATGVFQRAPEHPRVRTAQACEKCRIRKAKCSGEHPTCQRCKTRGLTCEYAPERKMRGPNKIKKRPISSAEAASGRRSSIASSGSSSDERSKATQKKHQSTAPFTTTPHKSTLSNVPEHGLPFKHQSSLRRAPDEGDESSQSEPSPFSSDSEHSPPTEKRRPAHIDITKNNILDFEYHHLPQHMSATAEIEKAVADQIYSTRRPSLPLYLTQAYSRIAQASAQQFHPEFHGNHTEIPSSFERTSIAYSLGQSPSHSQTHSGASSAGSLSAPITPIILHRQYKEEGLDTQQLQYPSYFEANQEYVHHHPDQSSEMLALDHHYGMNQDLLDPHLPLNADGWNNTSDAETPTIESIEKEKKLAQAVTSKA
ncbi:hypothetical protein C8Q75DRAFT_805497 [Abortiporus biennis]|nr:hypothetical protein C8Q75DRAFT_805497 [Abortiporus biennis]